MLRSRFNTFILILLLLAAVAYAAPAHTVQPGETLMAIARAELGSGARWKEIYELNRDKLASPDQVKAGMVLVMPAKGAVPGTGLATSMPATATRTATTTVTATTTANPTATATTTSAAGSEWIHVVQPGETLRSIARERCGGVEKWKEIFEMNTDKLASPDQVKAGMALKLPVRSSALAANSNPPVSLQASAEAAVAPAEKVEAIAVKMESEIANEEEPVVAEAAPPTVAANETAEMTTAMETVKTVEAPPAPVQDAAVAEEFPAEVQVAASEPVATRMVETPEAVIAPAPDRSVPTREEAQEEEEEMPVPAPPAAPAPASSRRPVTAADALDEARRELERVRAVAGAPASAPTAPTSSTPEEKATVAERRPAPQEPVAASKPAVAATPVSAVMTIEPDARPRAKCYTQKFPMRSGDRANARYGDELSAKLIAHWNRTGRIYSNPADADFTVLGQYWARDRELIVRVDIQKGMRIVKSLQWRVMKNELEMGETFYERMGSEIDAAMN